MKLPLLQSFKKIRALMGADFGTIKKLCSTCMSKWIRPITALLRKGVKHDLTPAMEVVVREILIELATAPSLVFPDWGDIADGSRPCHVSCDSCIGCLGAPLEQEQPGGSVLPIACINRVTLSIPRGTGPRWTWTLAA